MEESLLKIVYQNGDDLLLAVKACLETGESPNVITKYNESPLRVASRNGRFDVIKLLLSGGADEKQLGWTTLFHAIAYGSIENLEDVVTGTADLEHKDFWERTPLLFSILVGDIEKTSLLLKAGADRTAVGRCGRVPLTYAIQKDNLAMLDFLMEQGFDPEQRDDFSATPLIGAAEAGATKCLNALIAKGVDIFAKNHVPQAAIEYAANLDVVLALVKAGADINDVSKERRAEMLGYSVDMPPDISAEEYFKGRNRVFGRRNPQLAHNPFWQAMIKCGGSGYKATNKFESGKNSSFEKGPVWSFDRFGKSITLLPDGRFLEIAGEHEDHYDPDFCIYNDVFIHDGRGKCDIYIYPREVFPPTDFHTATLIGSDVYIIGSLGYPEDRRPGYTQVFRLELDNLQMERIETSGEMPGWINRHKAVYDGQSLITIKGGKLIIEKQGREEYVDNEHEYSLCLKSLKWRKL